MQDLLSADIREFSKYYTFQQDGASAHRVRDSFELLTMEWPDFIYPAQWPPNSADLYPSTTKPEELCKNKFRRESYGMSGTASTHHAG